MSQNKKTITIPASVGSNTLSETFGKISLGPEVKELLASLNAELSIRYIPGGEKPVVQVLAYGKPVCTLEEFKALSGYRRFVADALKEANKASASDEKVKLISHFLMLYKEGDTTVPARILEQNLTKFNQVGSSIQMLEKHLEVIEGTIDNEWRQYVLAHANTINRVLLSCQLACMGPEIVDKAFIEDGLFEARVPKWLYTKFCDKNFTNNLKRDCLTLLFPKGNFLKAMALTTKEIQHEGFRKANHQVLQSSGGIITLAASDFSRLFPSYPSELEEPVKDFLTGYQWVLTNPAPPMEILSLRETGKSLPVIRDIQAPKKAGRNPRPESNLAHTNRQISNILNKIQGVWNSIMNFSIPVANPKTEFWDLFFSVIDWEITPTNSIYNLIRKEAAAETALTGLREAPPDSALKRIAAIVNQTLMIPSGTSDAKLVVEVFKALKVENKDKGPKPDISATYTVATLSGYKPENITGDQIKDARSFLGLKETKGAKTKKRSGASAVRLHSSVTNELLGIKGHAIYDSVVDWLMTTFKTGDSKSLQLLAAKRILGEALKHQGVLFENFDEEEILEEIEEYYDSD